MQKSLKQKQQFLKSAKAPKWKRKVLQGWFFTHCALWLQQLESGIPAEALLRAVPQGRMIVLDLYAESRPRFVESKSFFGQPFIWCLLESFGGRSTFGGATTQMEKSVQAAVDLEGSTLCGIGLTMEGLFTSYPLYQFTLDRAWTTGSIDYKSWVSSYVRCRYGTDSDFLDLGCHLIWECLFQRQSRMSPSIFGYSPVTALPNLYISLPKLDETQIAKLLEAVRTLLGVNLAIVPNAFLFRHDIVDITREMLHLAIAAIYYQIVDAASKRDQERLKTKCSLFLKLLADLDVLLNSHENFMLGPFLFAATKLAGTPEEARRFRLSFINQLTLWGPNGEIRDYACKQWGGLVKRYYLGRWKLFFEYLIQCVKKSSLTTNDSDIQQRIFEEIERPFNETDPIDFPCESEGNSITLAKEALEKCVEIFGELAPPSTTERKKSCSLQ